ncbi:MAG: chalcone isomerase family protein [Gammaproteobacteria bacterium]
MRTSALFLSSSLILASFPVASVTTDGVEIPDTLTVANEGPALVLNGAGVREKLFLDIYIGALYLPAKSGDAQAILSGRGPACVTMHFLYKQVSREKITDAWEDGLAANHTAAEMQALQPQLEKFNALFRTMHKGEDIRICYLPGTGTEVRINGERSGNVEGETFFHALLAIWLGAHPVSNDLKQGMLGLD